MKLTAYRYVGLSQPPQNYTSEELLKRLIHRMARTTGAFRSTTQALLNGADEDPTLRRELLKDMDYELGELQRLLDNVTQFRALEKGTFALNRQELLVSPWLHQLVGRWQKAAPDKALLWAVDIADNLPMLRVDADKLEQALNNLLGNAAKHTPHGARVSVRAWSSGSEFRFCISCNPARLIPDDYDHLSELFYIGKVQGRFPTGIGLGLYVTRALIERHGGNLRITQPAEEDNSVEFEFTVPATPGNEHHEAAASSLNERAIASAAKGSAQGRLS